MPYRYLLSGYDTRRNVVDIEGNMNGGYALRYIADGEMGIRDADDMKGRYRMGCYV